MTKLGLFAGLSVLALIGLFLHQKNLKEMREQIAMNREIACAAYQAMPQTGLGLTRHDVVKYCESGF